MTHHYPRGSDMMTIDQVLKALRIADPTAPVVFDFCHTTPRRVDSWRGIYADPALGWQHYGRGSPAGSDATTVATLIAELEEAIAPGKTFEGWKGGQFSYSGRSHLHVDNPGDYSCTELARVAVGGYRVVLHTYNNEG